MVGTIPCSDAVWRLILQRGERLTVSQVAEALSDRYTSIEVLLGIKQLVGDRVLSRDNADRLWLLGFERDRHLRLVELNKERQGYRTNCALKSIDNQIRAVRMRRRRALDRIKSRKQRNAPNPNKTAEDLILIDWCDAEIDRLQSESSQISKTVRAMNA